MSTIQHQVIHPILRILRILSYEYYEYHPEIARIFRTFHRGAPISSDNTNISYEYHETSQPVILSLIQPQRLTNITYIDPSKLTNITYIILRIYRTNITNIKYNIVRIVRQQVIHPIPSSTSSDNTYITYSILQYDELEL